MPSPFSALTPLVGRQEDHLTCKELEDEVLSEARCEWLGPADATATPSSLASLKFRFV